MAGPGDLALGGANCSVEECGAAKSSPPRANWFRLGSLLILSLALTQNVPGATTETHRFTGLNRPIPDGNASGLCEVRSLTSAIVQISSLRVRLWIGGEFNGDLFAYVRHASAAGTNYCVLLNRPGRAASAQLGYPDAGLDVVLDDSAPSGDVHSYGAAGRLTPGTMLSGAWQPDGRTTDPGVVLPDQARSTSLASFLGQNPNGEWVLFVADLESGGTNVLLGWELELTGETALAGIPNQVAHVLAPLVFTNFLADPNRWAGPLTFGLGPDAPAGASIDPLTGVFQWTPSLDQARSVNTITVWVADSGSPPLRATNTFTVTVDDYAELIVGRTVMRVGDTNSVPLTLATSAALTNVDALLWVPEDRLTNLALVDWAPEVAGATLRRTMPNVWQVEFSAGPAQRLQATQELASLQFQAVSNRSAFVTVGAGDLAALQANGTGVGSAIAASGRVVVIDQEPLMEALRATSNQLQLALYGVRGRNYTIEGSPTLQPSARWAPVWDGLLPDLWMMLEGLTNSSPTPAMFFRAKESP